MFLLWLWYMMPWIAAVVMTRLCWRASLLAALTTLAEHNHTHSSLAGNKRDAHKGRASFLGQVWRPF